ncbi:MAG: PAS domain-containing protein [Thermoanaerobaculia bacterium]
MGSHLRFKVFPLAEGVATLFDNVTELHTLAARLEVSTALEAAVANHPDVASFILDPRGRLDTVSDTFCAATGFDADQLLKTKLVDIVAAPYRRAAVEAIEQTLALRNASTLDVVILKKTTEELLATLTIAPAVSEMSVNSLVGVALFKPFERVAQHGRVSAGASLRSV